MVGFDLDATYSPNGCGCDNYKWVILIYQIGKDRMAENNPCEATNPMHDHASSSYDVAPTSSMEQSGGDNAATPNESTGRYVEGTATSAPSPSVGDGNKNTDNEPMSSSCNIIGDDRCQPLLFMEMEASVASSRSRSVASSISRVSSSLSALAKEAKKLGKKVKGERNKLSLKSSTADSKTTKLSKSAKLFAFYAALNSCNLGYDIGVSTEAGRLIQDDWGLSIGERELFTGSLNFWASKCFSTIRSFDLTSLSVMDNIRSTYSNSHSCLGLFLLLNFQIIPYPI